MPLNLEGAAPAALDGELAIVQLGGKRYLHNRLSGELVLLQVAPGERVSLSFRGIHCILTCGRRSVWVSQLFQVQCLRRGPELLFVMQDSDADRSWKISSASSHTGTVTVELGIGSIAENFAVWAHSRSYGGAYIHWSLPSILRAIAVGDTAVGQLQKDRMWKRWQAMVAECGFPGDALLKASSYTGSADTITPRTPFRFSAASTHALLLLLTRWSGPHRHNGAVDRLRDGAQSLLQALLAYLPERFELVVFTSQVVLSLPHRISGEGPLTFGVARGVVQVRRALQDVAFAGASFVRSVAGKETCTLPELLSSSPCVGVVHSHEVGFLPQFLVQLAALVEPGLLQKDIVEISQGSCFSMIACLLKPKVAKK